MEVTTNDAPISGRRRMCGINIPCSIRFCQGVLTNISFDVFAASLDIHPQNALSIREKLSKL